MPCQRENYLIFLILSEVNNFIQLLFVSLHVWDGIDDVKQMVIGIHHHSKGPTIQVTPSPWVTICQKKSCEGYQMLGPGIPTSQ